MDTTKMKTIMTKSKMKKTSGYYKKKKTALVTVLTESNNFFILPTMRIFFDKAYSGRFDKLFLEFSWFNKTVAIRLK